MNRRTLLTAFLPGIFGFALPALASRANFASFGSGSRPRASSARRSRLVTSTKRSSRSSQYEPDLSGGEDPKGEVANPFQDLRTPGHRLHPSGVVGERSDDGSQ